MQASDSAQQQNPSPGPFEALKKWWENGNTQKGPSKCRGQSAHCLIMADKHIGDRNREFVPQPALRHIVVSRMGRKRDIAHSKDRKMIAVAALELILTVQDRN